MKKEFNADTCTVEEGIINCLEYEIENNAETDKDKERIAKSISDAVKDGHINGADAKKLLAALVQWLNSPAHRALLLAPNYRAAGVAVVKGKDGRVWCAMRFR